MVLDAGQLYFLLLPASSMPKGFKLWGTDSNGNAAPKDTRAPVPASKVCSDLQNTSYIRAGGFKTADWAISSFLPSDKSAEISEEITVFQGKDAQAAMTAMWNAFGHCKSYTFKAQGQTLDITLSRSKVNNKWPEIRAFQSSPQYPNSGTLVAIRVGNAIVTIVDSSDASNADYFAVSLAEKIASRVSSAEGLK